MSEKKSLKKIFWPIFAIIIIVSIMSTGYYGYYKYNSKDYNKTNFTMILKDNINYLEYSLKNNTLNVIKKGFNNEEYSIDLTYKQRTKLKSYIDEIEFKQNLSEKENIKLQYTDNNNEIKSSEYPEKITENLKKLQEEINIIKYKFENRFERGIKTVIYAIGFIFFCFLIYVKFTSLTMD